MNTEFGTIEILALILIAFVAIKIITILINPNLWLDFVNKLYSKPEIVSTLSLIFAILVLFFLIDAGVSIVEILAVCLFVSLLIMVGLASYADDVVGWVRQQDLMSMIKKMWLYTLIWVLLLVWGVVQIFSN